MYINIVFLCRQIGTVKVIKLIYNKHTCLSFCSASDCDKASANWSSSSSRNSSSDLRGGGALKKS